MLAAVQPAPASRDVSTARNIIAKCVSWLKSPRVRRLPEQHLDPAREWVSRPQILLDARGGGIKCHLPRLARSSTVSVRGGGSGFLPAETVGQQV